MNNVALLHSINGDSAQAAAENEKLLGVFQELTEDFQSDQISSLATRAVAAIKGNTWQN